MQTVDASIPLSVKQPQFDNPLDIAGKAMNLKSLQASTQIENLKLMQGMQTLKDQQELAGIAADPANLDPATGGFNSAALAKITNPTLRAKLTETRMGQLKDKVDIDYKTSQTAQIADERKSKALHDIMEGAYGVYEDTLKRTGNKAAATEAFNKSQLDGYEDIKKSGRGGFAADTQFRLLTPEDVGAKLITHKERVDEQAKKDAATRGEETPFIKETRHVENLKHQLDDLKPNDPARKPIIDQIRKVEAHIARLDRMPGAAGEKADKAPSGYRYKKDGNLEKIPGGPADKDHRDTLQADALAAYRAKYPNGYMPDMYGKTQPTPEDYTEQYVKNKEAGGKGLPKDPKPSLPKVDSKASFDKLKKGDKFIDSRDGQEKVKG